MMLHRFHHFLQFPSRETYLAARDVLLRGPAFNPYSTELERVVELLGEGGFGEAEEVLRDAYENLALTPTAHWFAAVIAEKRGQLWKARTEAHIARLCSEGILSTGAGSRTRPYLVTRTRDEHDAVKYLGKQIEEQMDYHDGRRHYDVIDCRDGSRVWFDVTAPYRKLQQQLAESE